MPDLGRHFVLLIDDSGDMDHFEDSIKKELPKLFFGAEEERTVAWPAFDPDRDVLSTFFFTIHRDGSVDTCKAQRSFSTLPEAMFQQATFDGSTPLDGEVFRHSLENWLALPCRWQGTFSPIITATTLAIPFAAQHVEPRAFSNTLLVVVTNDFFNTTVSPAFELRHLTHNPEGQFLRDTVETEQQLEEVLQRFRFDLPDGWSRDVKTTGSPLFIRIFRVHPRATTPEALVAVSPRVELDRVATSPERIVWRGGRLGTDRVRLTSADGLTPVSLAWRIHDGRERSWVLGAHPVPTGWRSLELADCGLACSQEGDAVVVALGEVLELPPMAPGDPVPQNPGVLDFRVAFRFDSGGVYDLLHPTTSLRRIELRTAPVASLKPFPLASAKPVTNQVLADLWSSRDAASGNRGLTQAAAFDRLLARRNRQSLMLGLTAIAATALGVLTLFRTAYHRPFQPALDWRSAGPISLDLSQGGASRLLVGTVGVVNHGRQPWFGRLLRHDEQPTRQATLELAGTDIGSLGFQAGDRERTTIGFLRSENGDSAENPAEPNAAASGDEIVPAIRRSVSHGQRVPIFVATETLADFERAGEDVAEAMVHVESSAQLIPLADARVQFPVSTPTSFEIRVLPEVATPPRVWFEAAQGRLEFRKGEEVEVGAFVFESLARHHFASPFVSNYDLEVLKDRVPLGSLVLRLASSKVRVASGERRRVPVLLHCDGETVRNPEPSQQSYSVHLLGPCHPDSKRGPHEIVLHRDSTRAEAEIQVSYLGDVWDLHRTVDEEVALRNTRTGRTMRAVGGVLVFEGDYPFRIPPERRQDQDPTLASLQIGNSGRSGRGRVCVEVRRRLDMDPQAAGCLHLAGGASGERLLVCFRQGEEIPFTGMPNRVLIEVAEGQPEEERTFKLHGEPVERIDGARLTADQIRAVLEMKVRVVDDQGEEREWQVDLVARVSIEKLPGLNWLCIDFGTSAIAAAVGRADGDVFHRLDLQHLEILPGGSLATADHNNLEAGTPFLPSWIVCDGDIRRREGTQPEVDWPAGFPLHRPASIDLHHPSFIGLPALQSHLLTRPGRLVFSLKQWLARLAPAVRLGDPATYRTSAGEERTSRLVPLDDLLESMLGAFVDCYLLRAPNLEANQVVLTHPNTFSARHRERFHRVATRVLQKRLGIAAPEHVTLLSESDAVAYAYCVAAMGGAGPRRGTERILVYDFGAGTLDLSLLRVDWRTDRRQPRNWTIEARLGLPLAGNYIDELLMRLVDQQLRRDEVVAGTGCEYRHPAVEWRASKSDPARHQEAVLKTWTALRQAKHKWDGLQRFEVVVGHPGGLGGVVSLDREALRLPAEASADEVALLLAGNEIRLSIPASVVRSDKPLIEFLRLVTDEAIGELLALADLQSAAVDTLIVSGRGALWPGLREGVQATLPRAILVESGDAFARKDVVPRGAIAFQALRHRLSLESAGPARPRLGILLGRRHLVTEADWADGRAVDLDGCDEFRLVQIPLHFPDVERDLASLRRHFYVELTDAPIRCQTLWKDDPRLFVKVDERGEHLRVSLSNALGQTIDIDHEAGPQRQPPDPPWPTGSFLLDPEELQLDAAPQAGGRP